MENLEDIRANVCQVGAQCVQSEAVHWAAVSDALAMECVYIVFTPTLHCICTCIVIALAST